jgi:hypothetical protein
MWNKGLIYVKSNWKAMIFAVIYVFLLYISLALSLNIRQPGGEFNFWLFLSSFVAVMSLYGLIAKIVLKAIFKDEAEQVAKNAGIVLIPILILTIMAIIFAFISALPFPYYKEVPFFDGSNVAPIVNFFMITLYIILMALIEGILLLLAFLAFAFLRYSMKYTKIVLIICVVSVIFTLLCVSGTAFQKNDYYHDTVVITAELNGGIPSEIRIYADRRWEIIAYYTVVDGKKQQKDTGHFEEWGELQEFKDNHPLYTNWRLGDGYDGRYVVVNYAFEHLE